MKEIPVSEATTGDDARQRPEMNAGGVGNETGGNPVSKHQKTRRRRRRKSKNKSDNGIQADAIADSTPVQKPEQNETRPDHISDIFHPPNKGKRARRRNNRRRKSNGAPAEVGDQTTSDDNASNRKNGHRTQSVKTGEFAQLESNVPNTSSPNPSHKAKKRPQANHRRHRFDRRASEKRADAYAALDLGTNNCRLLVATPQQPGRFRVLDAFSRIVRLGEGLTSTGRLSDAAMDRAVGALKTCARKLENRNVRGVRLIATEACRRASNGAEFLRRVEEEAGLKLEIIDRETEARLAVAGCTTLVDRKANGVVLFDIGGGSSELALLDLRKHKHYDLSKAMVAWTSLPHGVVTLSEIFGGGKLVTREVFEDMVDEVSKLLNDFEGSDALKDAAKSGEIHLLGTSGTVTTLAGIHLELPKYDRNRVDGLWMNSRDVDAMIDALVDMNFEQRVANPCIGRDRADLVLAGCAILVAIQRIWPCERLRVADRGLREGLLTEMMNADNAWQRRSKFRRPRKKKSGKRA